MSNTCIFISDIGTQIILDTQSDISTATTFRIYYEDPNGSTGFFPGSLNGTDNVEYTTTSSDFNVIGLWTLQAYVEYSGGNKFYGCKVSLEVKGNL